MNDDGQQDRHHKHLAAIHARHASIVVRPVLGTLRPNGPSNGHQANERTLPWISQLSWSSGLVFWKSWQEIYPPLPGEACCDLPCSRSLMPQSHHLPQKDSYLGKGMWGGHPCKNLCLCHATNISAALLRKMRRVRALSKTSK